MLLNILIKHQFSYTPRYSDLLYLGIFLIGGGTIALLQYPFFIPPVWLIVIIGFYLFIKNKPAIYFFDEYIELKKGWGKEKKAQRLNYSDIQRIEYCFAEVRGSHLFRVIFSKNLNIGSIQFSFNGRPSRSEVLFLESKKLPIKVVPENAMHKLYQNVK